jgi:hypothetical protein
MSLRNVKKVLGAREVSTDGTHYLSGLDCWRRLFWGKTKQLMKQLGNGPEKEHTSKNREKQCRERRKDKGRMKEADQRRKRLDFGPIALRELESGKT